MTEGRRSGGCEDGVSADGYFRVLRFFGTLTALDLVDLLQTPSATHALDGVTLFDICDATFNMGYRDARFTSDEINATRGPKKARAAVLAADDLGYGLGRMYVDGAGLHYEHQQVFRDRGEALEWLGVSTEQVSEAIAALEPIPR